MENKNWIVGLIALVIIVVVAIIGFGKIGNKNISGASTTKSEVKQITGQEDYFSADAKVMYFYQPTCHYCLLQSPILSELAVEGYRVKPMDGSKDPSVWAGFEGSKYNVNGTPSFIADNGDRLEGMQQKEALKAFLDAHK